MAPSQTTILIVEDDVLIGMAKMTFLKSEGFVVIHVTSGEEAITIIREGKHNIGLILMDIDLGKNRMKGTEAARIILKDFEKPLVFLSSHLEREIVELTENITSYGYIVKNSGNTVLLASIKMALKLYDSNRKLQEKETNLQLSQQVAKLGHWKWNLTTGYIDWSLELYRIFGFTSDTKLSPEEILKQSVHPEDLSLVINVIFDTANKSHQQKEFRIIKKDGSVRTILSTLGESRSNEAGVTDQMFGVMQDVTENKIAEENNIFLANLLENLIDAVISTDLNFVITSWNRGAERIYGFKAEEAIGKTTTEILRAVFYEGHLDDVRIQYDKNNRWIGEVTHYTKQGKKLNIYGSVAKLYDRNGNHIGAVSINHDITEKKEIEEKIIKNERKLKEAQRISHVGSWDWDVKEGIVNWSDEVFEIFGISRENFDNTLEMSIQFYHPDDIDYVKEMTEKAVKDKKQYPLDVRIIRPNGEIRYIYAQGEMQFDEHDQLIHMTGTYLDITERKLAEIKIKELLNEKEILLEEVHHRIKNNMQSINGLLQIKCKSVNDEEVASILQQTINQVEGMGMLYDRLYRTENFSNVNVREYFSELIENILKVSVIPKDLSLELELDDFNLKSELVFPLCIIVNEVLSNAIKYAFKENQENFLSVKMFANDSFLVLEIQDSGNGFVPEFVSSSKKNFGLKLILMLSEQMQAIHRFDFSNGTKFILEIPI